MPYESIKKSHFLLKNLTYDKNYFVREFWNPLYTSRELFREDIEFSKPGGNRMKNISSNKLFFQSCIQTLCPELQQALHAALHSLSST